MRCRRNASRCIWLLFLCLPFAPTSAASQAPGRVVFPFPAFPACGQPIGPLTADRLGNLYGTASLGGTDNSGCIFELTPSADGWQETTIYSFSGPDGSGPRSALTFDKSGNIYGTAGGGAYGAGVAFELSPSGDGSWTETVLHDFGSGSDARGPESNLVFDDEGNLYGTTSSGGSHETGTVYKLSPSGEGWTESVLYSFQSGINGPDGDAPMGAIVMNRGHLYGVTETGGEYGDGAVFELSPSKEGYEERIILSLDGTDGLQPTTGLAMDDAGNLYGTTTFGGGASGDGAGTVFKLAKGSDGSWSEETLLVLNGNDGYIAVGPPAMSPSGDVYAAAESGGAFDMGSVFRLAPGRSGNWVMTMLHQFDFKFPNGEDGAGPYAGVIFLDGRLFGTTSLGGINDDGIVFEIAPPSGTSVAATPEP